MNWEKNFLIAEYDKEWFPKQLGEQFLLQEDKKKAALSLD